MEENCIFYVLRLYRLFWAQSIFPKTLAYTEYSHVAKIVNDLRFLRFNIRQIWAAVHVAIILVGLPVFVTLRVLAEKYLDFLTKLVMVDYRQLLSFHFS